MRPAAVTTKWLTGSLHHGECFAQCSSCSSGELTGGRFVVVVAWPRAAVKFGCALRTTTVIFPPLLLLLLLAAVVYLRVTWSPPARSPRSSTPPLSAARSIHSPAADLPQKSKSVLKSFSVICRCIATRFTAAWNRQVARSSIFPPTHARNKSEPLEPLGFQSSPPQGKKKQEETLAAHSDAACATARASRAVSSRRRALKRIRRPTGSS